MKKLILLLLGSISIAIGMQRPEPSVTINSVFKPTDEALTKILFHGSINELKKMLDEPSILAHRNFTKAPYAGKSLLEVTLELQLSPIIGKNTLKEKRYEIAHLLLERGADARILNRFLVPAVKVFNDELVNWLVEHGAKDTGGAAEKLVNELENDPRVAPVRKKILAKIKTILSDAKNKKQIAP
jgi:hypothetical protein